MPRTVVRIIAASQSGPLDCEDEETAHVWVRVLAWSPRRAFLTGASPFVTAAGKEAGDLVGSMFFADLDLNAVPGNEDTTGERLEWPGLVACAPVDVERLLAQSGRVDGAPAGGEA